MKNIFYSYTTSYTSRDKILPMTFVSVELLSTRRIFVNTAACWAVNLSRFEGSN